MGGSETHQWLEFIIVPLSTWERLTRVINETTCIASVVTLITSSGLWTIKTVSEFSQEFLWHAYLAVNVEWIIACT